MAIIQEDEERRLIPYFERGSTPDILPEWTREQGVSRETQMTQWQGITMLSANMGRPVDDNWVLSHVDPSLREEAQRAIDATGVHTRYISPSEPYPQSPDKESTVVELETRTLEQTIDDTGRISAHLLGEIEEQTGLIPDHFITANLALPIKVNKKTRHYAKLPDTVTDESVRAACAGGAIALIKALADPKLQGKTVAILAHEPMGHLLHPKHYLLEHIAIPSLFTSMHEAWVLKTDEWELVDYAIKVIPGGGISVRTSYDDQFDIGNGLGTIPDYLRGHIVFENGGEQVLYINENGLFLQIPHPENGLSAVMNGMETARHFGDLTPEFYWNFVQRQLDNGMDPKRVIVACHQPSKPVIHRINRELRKLPGPVPPEFLLPFDLPEMQTANGSSPLTLRHAHHVIEKTQVNNPTLVDAQEEKDEIVMVSMGIGSVFVAARIRKR